MSGKKSKEKRRGHIYQPKYRDRKTGELVKAPGYWIKYSYLGQRYRENAQTTDFKVAEQKLTDRLAGTGKGVKPKLSAEKIMFSHLAQYLLDDYVMNKRRSLKRAKIAAKRLGEKLGTLRAIDISTPGVLQYIKQRQDNDHVKDATISAELAALKKMFSLAIKHDVLLPAHRPHIPTLTLNNARTGFFERPEYDAVLEHLPADIRPVITFAYLTGWRVPSEILTLTWPQIDFAHGEVRLEPGTTKNQEGRTFPFALIPELGEMLQQQRQHVQAIEKATGSVIPWVFVRDDGQPIVSFRMAWRKALKAAGLAGRIPHDFRRTAVRNLERAGVPRSVAMKLTGHKTMAVYNRYAIASKGDLADGVAKLAALHTLDRQQAKKAPKVVSMGTVKAGTKRVKAASGG